MHEIITLQLGERSNYVATHFWNTQESYFTYEANEESPVDHNVHFRPGIGADGTETFTPRTLIYDLKGGFGNLRQYNALYELEEQIDPSGIWGGNDVIQKQPPIPQNEYQKSLDLGLPPPRLTSEAVRYWSDFNRVFYHPKSIVQLNEYELNSQLMPFEDWAIGEELFSSIDREHDILDRDLRPFAEESDQLSAIQIFSGTDDAWGGFTARYIESLRDEFGKKDIWVWAIEDGSRTQRSKKSLATANSARSLSEISPQATAYIPMMGPPRSRPSYLTGDLGSKWYSSAILSMAMESVSLPARLRQHHGLASWLAGEGSRKIFNLQCTVTGDQYRTRNGESARDTSAATYENDYDPSHELLDDFELDFSPYEPAKSEGMHVFTQARVNRDSNRFKDGAPEVDNNIGQQDRRMEDLTNFQSFNSALEFPILDSFPHDLLSGQGQVGSTVGVRAALSATTGIGKQVKELRKFVGRAVGAQERETLVNGLAEIEEGYQHSWESGSDSGED